MSRLVFANPNSIEARQGLLDNRSEHKPKNHRTLKRRRALSAAKRAKVKHDNAIKKANRGRYLAAVRAYWDGSADVHP